MKEGELETSLLTVIGDAGGKDALIDAAELAFDATLESGVLKDIPVVGTVAKLFSVAQACQGYVFTKKVRRFVVEYHKITTEEKLDFSKSVDTDSAFRERVAETLVTLLDRLDDISKAPMLARAFAAFVRGDIDFESFQRLAVGIDRCLVADLFYLKKLTKAEQLPAYVGDVLASAGFASLVSIPAIKAAGVGNQYEISALGELFVEIVLGYHQHQK